jgi:hypothetical protein
MRARFHSFAVVEINDKGQMVGVDINGDRREFSLTVNVDEQTRKTTMGVAYHYIDAKSVPAFENTIPWELDARRS